MIKVIEHPILFNADMVRAILNGLKTQTRRPINRLLGNITEFEQSDTPGYGWTFRDRRMLWNDIRHSELLELCPLGQPGDRLWVRETYRPIFTQTGHLIALDYKADPEKTWERLGNKLGTPGKWRPSIHMPRSASRITLEITNVRVERLQDITEEDAIEEGIERANFKDGLKKYFIPAHTRCTGEGDSIEDYGYGGSWTNDPRDAFHGVWNSFYGSGSWEANPWVWVIDFEVA